jgi:hypothetical protein
VTPCVSGNPACAKMAPRLHRLSTQRRAAGSGARPPTPCAQVIPCKVRDGRVPSASRSSRGTLGSRAGWKRSAPRLDTPWKRGHPMEASAGRICNARPEALRDPLRQPVGLGKGWARVGRRGAQTPVRRPLRGLGKADK